MIVAQWETLPGPIHAVSFINQNVSRIGTSKGNNVLSDLSAKLHSDVSVVHYKTAKDK